MATEYQTEDKIPPRRDSLINPFDPSFWRDRILISVFACRPPRLLPLLLPTVLVARHRDVVNVLRDYELFSTSSPGLPPRGGF
jgi:hypothetical protein